MSGEVINRAVLHDPAGMDERPPFVHEAIHDVESLLWVVVRLCLTRKGPGLNMRRDEELDEGSLKCNHKLRDLIIRLFDGEQEVLKKTKMDLHSHWKSFNDQVIVYFHPYFDPLKPFVLRWWNTLILGYKYRADEYYHIHDHILGIIDEAIECVKTIPDDEQARKAELKRRRKCKEHRLGTFSSKTPEMPPLSTSPSELEPLMRTPQQRHQSLEQDPDSPTAALSRKMRETHI
ncbi:hypothetical protein C0993_001559 [Termitomyces sp. T159_Od127]|nr:hypothetical protein C0993_001559 [Termitomyces sp. T159_Od127]